MPQQHTPAAGSGQTPEQQMREFWEHEFNQASSSTSSLHCVGRLHAGEHLVGNPSGVGVSSVGVEILPLGSAPFGEIVRVNVNADHAHAFFLQSFAADFGCSQPLIVGPMEFVTILKHGSQLAEVLPLEPNHAGGLNTLGHAESPEVGDTATVAQPGGAA